MHKDAWPRTRQGDSTYFSSTADDDQGSFQSFLDQVIDDVGIPMRPEIVDRIIGEIRSREPNFHHLGNLIAADVSLSASLVKTVNSPSFGYSTSVRTSSEALLLLGLDVACRAIAGISLHRLFAAAPNANKLLQRATRIAALSGWLASEFSNGGLRADEAYTYGLFRDCGALVLLGRFKAYARIHARATEEIERDFTAVEREALLDFPIDHALVGCLLAQNWWLPRHVCLAVQFHHDLQLLVSNQGGLPISSRHLIAAGQTAEYVLQRVGGEFISWEWGKLGPTCQRLLDLTAGDLQSICDRAEPVIAAVE